MFSTDYSLRAAVASPRSLCAQLQQTLGRPWAAHVHAVAHPPWSRASHPRVDAVRLISASMDVRSAANPSGVPMMVPLQMMPSSATLFRNCWPQQLHPPCHAGTTPHVGTKVPCQPT